MAVYTELSQQDINSILSLYPLSDVTSYEPVSGGKSNTNYKIETNEGIYFLTIFEETSPNNAPAILEYMKSLYKEGLPTPNIIKKKEGDFLFSFHERQGCLQVGFDGHHIDNPTTEHCLQAGELLAHLHSTIHTHAQTLKNPYNSRKLEELLKASRRNADKAQKEKIQIALNELFTMRRYTIDKLPRGMVHCDYFKDNLLFHNNEISGLIDFWLSCEETYIYDLAIALNVWGFHEGVFQKENFKSFCHGYKSVRMLSEDEKNFLPAELKRSSIHFFTSRLYDELISSRPTKNSETWFKRLIFYKEGGLPHTWTTWL